VDLQKCGRSEWHLDFWSWTCKARIGKALAALPAPRSGETRPETPDTPVGPMVRPLESNVVNETKRTRRFYTVEGRAEALWIQPSTIGWGTRRGFTPGCSTVRRIATTFRGCVSPGACSAQCISFPGQKRRASRNREVAGGAELDGGGVFPAMAISGLCRAHSMGLAAPKAAVPTATVPTVTVPTVTALEENTP
jgi:hypothetical protein